MVNESGAESNLVLLTQVLSDYFKLPLGFQNYDDLFKYLGERGKNQIIILIIDEFTYLMSTNYELWSVIQNAIDTYLLDSQVKLIFSGSHVGMVEDALSYKEPLYGRSTFKIKLAPFNYYEASLFYPKMRLEDKVVMYAVFGGIPYYLNRIDDELSVKENIINLI